MVLRSTRALLAPLATETACSLTATNVPLTRWPSCVSMVMSAPVGISSRAGSLWHATAAHAVISTTATAVN